MVCSLGSPHRDLSGFGQEPDELMDMVDPELPAASLPLVCHAPLRQKPAQKYDQESGKTLIALEPRVVLALPERETLLDITTGTCRRASSLRVGVQRRMIMGVCGGLYLHRGLRIVRRTCSYSWPRQLPRRGVR